MKIGFCTSLIEIIKLIGWRDADGFDFTLFDLFFSTFISLRVSSRDKKSIFYAYQFGERLVRVATCIAINCFGIVAIFT
jgi:hypothetical protein